MSYTHTAVRGLAGHSDPASKVLNERVEAAKAVSWLHWLDGVPVSPPVYELGMGVRKAYPFVKFYVAPAPSCRWGFIDGFCEHAWEVFVAMDTCPYVLAKIGHGGYRDAYNGNFNSRHYMVSARGIKNLQYSEAREQYCMRLASSLKVAVKNTLANLIPYTIQEVADREYLRYYNKSKAISTAKAEQLPALVKCVTSEVLLNEVRALKAAGVVFSTPEFRRVADNCDDAARAAREERSKRVDAVLVHFVARPDGVVAECAGMLNIRRSHEFVHETSAIYSVADVPQAIQDKIAVLQTLLPGDHVDGVGMKVEDMLYWVEK